jgi:hypothetical protein
LLFYLGFVEPQGTDIVTINQPRPLHQRLNLKSDELLSSFAICRNLRHLMEEAYYAARVSAGALSAAGVAEALFASLPSSGAAIVKLA